MTITSTQRISAKNESCVSNAVDLLREGKLVALPTETVYGLGANACDENAVKSIYLAKGRPSNNPLICHVSDVDMARNYVEVCDIGARLARAFWPGPLTLVLPKKPNSAIAETASAGLETLAVRSPNNPTTRAIIKSLEQPVAAPSANPSGKLSPTTAADVMDGLDGRVSLIVDDGPADVGIESTIISVIDGTLRLLRPGSITADDIADVAGQPVLARDSDNINAPGQLSSHYAPGANVRLNAHYKQSDECFVGFGSGDFDYNLSAEGDLTEAAKNLFSTLRKADQTNPSAIAIAPIPETGVGVAINDRLMRAAAPRGLE